MQPQERSGDITARKASRKSNTGQEGSLGAATQITACRCMSLSPLPNP